MNQQNISLTDLTSAVLEVRSYFAKRGITLKVSKKKSPVQFTSGPNFPMVIQTPEGMASHACLFERKKFFQP